MLEKAEKTYKVEEFNSITGQGIEGRVEGEQVKVISPGAVRKLGLGYPVEQVEELSSQGKTVVFVIINDKLEGASSLGDLIREESRRAIEPPHQMGIESTMPTGDNRQTGGGAAGQSR